MSTSNDDDVDGRPEEHIEQKAGNNATQIGKVVGTVNFTRAMPAIVVIAVIIIAAVTVTGVNLPRLMGVIVPSSTPRLTATPTPSPTLTPSPTATIGLTKTPVFVSPIPCLGCGQVSFAIATPVPDQRIKKTNLIEVRQFALDPSVSSYSFDGQAFDLDPHKMDTMLLQGCLPDVQNLLPRIKTNLQLFARQSGREDLLPYIQTEAQIQTLRIDRPEVVNQLIPTSAEWQQMDQTEYEALNAWVLNCVGIPWPAWYVTLGNTSDQEQVITKILYRTLSTSEIRGGEAGAVSPKVTYIHQIDWKVGDQVVELIPAFRIPPRSNAGLELMLTTGVPNTGMGWDLQIFFIIDDERGGVSTEPFTLYMSGLPAP